LRFGLADCEIGIPAEIVPKPFVECRPFLLLPLPHYSRAGRAKHPRREAARAYSLSSTVLLRFWTGPLDACRATLRKSGM